MTSRSAFLIAVCALCLAACGTKGPLTLPGATPAPKQQVQAPAPQTAGDHNSPANPPAPR